MLTQRDFDTLNLALDVLSADTARRQKVAMKRRDDTALARLRVTGDNVITARRKLFEIQAKSPTRRRCRG